MSSISYFIRRNSRGVLPVYSDVRRSMIEIRNVDGRVHSLANDLRVDLGASVAKIKHNRHVVLAARTPKRDVVAWLAAKGF